MVPEEILRFQAKFLPSNTCIVFSNEFAHKLEEVAWPVLRTSQNYTLLLMISCTPSCSLLCINNMCKAQKSLPWRNLQLKCKGQLNVTQWFHEGYDRTVLQREVTVRGHWLPPCCGKSTHTAGFALLTGSFLPYDLVAWTCKWLLPKSVLKNLIPLSLNRSCGWSFSEVSYTDSWAGERIHV